jgi:hypothetical protein
MRKTLTLTAVLALSLGLLPPGVAQAATGDPLVFQELTPCALFDTRPSQGGTGALAGGESRTFHVVGSTSNFAAQGGTAGGCGIPGFSGGDPQTEMVYLNLVAVDPAAGGNLKVWATDDPEPQGGVVNYQKLTPNLNTSNSIVVGVRQDTEGSDITVKANVSSTHVRGVALGYLSPAEASAWLLEGNAGTDPATNFLGTTDNQPLNFRVNDARAFRLEPTATSPNVIGGFSGNAVTAGALGATIGGGGASTLTNKVTDDYGTVGGGRNNQAGDNAGTTTDRPGATVGGGFSNIASTQLATVGGGIANTANGNQSTVGGGETNTASGTTGTVGGGSGNTASGQSATVGGGGSNTASGTTGTVGGGGGNTASGLGATVGGGSGNTASGQSATVPGGSQSTAAGVLSLAAGTRAKANHDGSFVWADFQSADMASSANNQFIARASGGFFLQSDSTLDSQGGFINTTTGAFLSNVGVWTNASDAALKTDFTPVDPAGVLDQVADMPVTSWSYRAEPGVVHIGPTAQDFHAAFGLGSDDETIGTVDADGVALAAIQGLNEKVEEKDARLAELESRLAAVEDGRPAPAGLPVGAWWGLSAALGLLGLGVGRRWGRRGLIA